MKKLAALILLTLLFSGCDKEVGGGEVREFDTDKALTLNHGDANNPFTITDGDQIVFSYSFNHPHEEDIADDELTEQLIFSIPSDQSSFEITTTHISGGSIFPIAYRRICFCFFEFGFSIESVQINGTKISPTRWEISMEMTATDGEHTYTLSDQGVYHKTDF